MSLISRIIEVVSAIGADIKGLLTRVQALEGSGFAFSPTAVTSGSPITVPAGQQWVLYSDTLYVDDDLTLEGDLVMLL